MEPPDDNSIIDLRDLRNKLQNGDQSAYRYLERMLKGFIHTKCSPSVYTYEDREDILRDTIENIYKDIHRNPEKIWEHPSTYIYTIALRTIDNYYNTYKDGSAKRSAKKKGIDLEVKSFDLRVLESGANSYDDDQVTNAPWTKDIKEHLPQETNSEHSSVEFDDLIKDLSEKDQRMFHLYNEGFDRKQIAEELDEPHDTTRQRLRRAQEKNKEQHGSDYNLSVLLPIGKPFLPWAASIVIHLVGLLLVGSFGDGENSQNATEPLLRVEVFPDGQSEKPRLNIAQASTDIDSAPVVEKPTLKQPGASEIFEVTVTIGDKMWIETLMIKKGGDNNVTTKSYGRD